MDSKYFLWILRNSVRGGSNCYGGWVPGSDIDLVIRPGFPEVADMIESGMVEPGDPQKSDLVGDNFTPYYFEFDDQDYSLLVMSSKEDFEICSTAISMMAAAVEDSVTKEIVSGSREARVGLFRYFKEILRKFKGWSKC